MTNSNALIQSSRDIDLTPIDDALLEESQIFLTGEINPESANALIKKLMYIDKKDLGEVTIYIDSHGDEVISGLAVYDYIRIMKSPVKIVCIGDTASMGTIVFLAGEKREMLPHSRILIHDPSYEHLNVSGKNPYAIHRKAESLKKVRETLAEIISGKTGKSLDEIYRITAEDHCFTADEAIEFGLANGIFKGETE